MECSVAGQCRALVQHRPARSGHAPDAAAAVVDGMKVGLAVCGAFLVGNLSEQDGTFPTCSECMAMLENR